ncbi:hypothetical protein PIB30_050839, partial [Stylosanthes scabra]|nr:hypothetical protein [Stylosanthes scabra]
LFPRFSSSNITSPSPTLLQQRRTANRTQGNPNSDEDKRHRRYLMLFDSVRISG